MLLLKCFAVQNNTLVFVFFNIHRKVIITIKCPVTLPTIYLFYETGEFIPSFLATLVVSTFYV